MGTRQFRRPSEAIDTLPKARQKIRDLERQLFDEKEIKELKEVLELMYRAVEKRPEAQGLKKVCEFTGASETQTKIEIGKFFLKHLDGTAEKAKKLDEEITVISTEKNNLEIKCTDLESQIETYKKKLGKADSKIKQNQTIALGFAQSISALNSYLTKEQRQEWKQILQSPGTEDEKALATANLMKKAIVQKRKYDEAVQRAQFAEQVILGLLGSDEIVKFKNMKFNSLEEQGDYLLDLVRNNFVSIDKYNSARNVIRNLEEELNATKDDYSENLESARLAVGMSDDKLNDALARKEEAEAELARYDSLFKEILGEAKYEEYKEQEFETPLEQKAYLVKALVDEVGVPQASYDSALEQVSEAEERAQDAEERARKSDEKLAAYKSKYETRKAEYVARIERKNKDLARMSEEIELLKKRLKEQ